MLALIAHNFRHRRALAKLSGLIMTSGLVFALLMCLAAAPLADTQYNVPTVKKCITANNYLHSFGDGSTPGSCMACDPAVPECGEDCQGSIGAMYVECDSICLPDGYYFDALSTVSGCWEAAKPELKIMVERCGCDAAPRGATLLLSLVIFVTAATAWVLL